MPKDFLGNILAVGDKVVFMQLRYRNFMKGTLVSTNGEQIGFIKPEESDPWGTEIRQYYSQMIKITDSEPN